MEWFIIFVEWFIIFVFSYWWSYNILARLYLEKWAVPTIHAQAPAASPSNDDFDALIPSTASASSTMTVKEMLLMRTAFANPESLWVYTLILQRKIEYKTWLHQVLSIDAFSLLVCHTGISILQHCAVISIWLQKILLICHSCTQMKSIAFEVQQVLSSL